MEYTKINEEGFYKIENSDSLRPFFMSVVSDSDHWMFISSNGGLTAGRRNSEYSLFPYYTDDKITESFETTGSKTIFLVESSGKNVVWEPFSDRYTGVFNYTRNLYKNEYGNKLIFEEVNHDIGLRYRCEWNSSTVFGFVKRSTLLNMNGSSIKVKLLDGLQNVLPYGIATDVQVASSNLVDAYKKSELLEKSGLGIFTLSAIIVDKAEPSEALKANVVWSLGLDSKKVLLSSIQLNAFRKTGIVNEEKDIRAEKGAYLVASELDLAANAEKEWLIIANVNQGPSAVVNLSEKIKSDKNLWDAVMSDVELGTQNLLGLTTAADGKQVTADNRRNTRHYANVLFNIMRGGIFDDNYTIEKQDFINYIRKANNEVFVQNNAVLEGFPEKIQLPQLKQLAAENEDRNFSRLCLEYLPLKFSRRHGDPSRPWNKFSINTRNEIDGSKVLDYQGNWRDIFQNWEALAHSYPEFMENMIHKFLNATTFDGYNPYRVTKDGFDWETIEPDDPWSYIGYWGDHQIIYLLKFLEFIEGHYPNKLAAYFNADFFVYANVPYVIKPYAELVKNPKDTIEFNEKSDAEIREKRNLKGADGALLHTSDNAIYRVNLIEKLLATLLAKCSNFIPEGGIWMNTQRPEWNDANNALVGNGVSMVTLYYMRRFFIFFKKLVENASVDKMPISTELNTFFKETIHVLQSQMGALNNTISNKDRKTVMDGLGIAASDYRTGIYAKGFSTQKENVTKNDLLRFSEMVLIFIDHSIKANKRTDNLYHAYNLMTVENDEEVSISYLSEMLEGQVAVLSSGYLNATQCLEVLDALKQSALFREDQYSYLLYPNKELPRFTERNNIPKDAIFSSKLVQQLLADGNLEVVEQDVKGDYHFNGKFNNAKSLETALNALDSSYKNLVASEKESLLQVFEDVFNHKSFTGRSGTFYGYEGLGSIYWHMVSKLALAVQECCIKAFEEQESDEVIGRLLEHYYEINAGIGVHKSPELYGAFPTDPYSHTPGGKGAQQPGMTGQVKEDILNRFAELGLVVTNGVLHFKPRLVLRDEFLTQPANFEYIALSGECKVIELAVNTLCFTYCQVPIIYKIATEESIMVSLKDGTIISIAGSELGSEYSAMLFERSGEISKLTVSIIK